ncbi:12883_t:CDS:2, partial [Racocetra fulgida]
MTVAIRGLMRHIWVNVDPPSILDSLEKEAAIKLLVGFAISMKYYLREEGIEHEDLKPYISNIVTAIPAFEQLIEQEDKVIEKKKNPRIDIKLFKNKIVGASAAKLLLYDLNILVDSLSGCERILRTPIPLAYAVHISQTVWLYCISLSFQLVSTLHYTTLPIVLIASIILFGIEAIGEEIENPFGYDYNDLDLDGFCNDIKEEVETFTKYPRPTVEDWEHETTSIIDIKEKILSHSCNNIFDIISDVTATHDEIDPNPN